jgi:hypothetical protein
MLILLGRNSYIRDPTTIQMLFEISQALHDDLDFVNVKDDDNHPAHLISRFVHMVNNFKPMPILPISQVLRCDCFVVSNTTGLI